MISFTTQPEEVALFGVNPQWVEVTTDGTDADLVCELIVYLWNGASYDEVTRLESPYTSLKATFNISKLIEGGYDLPASNQFTALNVTTASNLIKRYKIEAEEYLNDVQQGSTINFEARAIDGRHGTLEALDIDFFQTGEQQLLSKKPLYRKISRTQPEWAYVLTQAGAILSYDLLIKIYLSDGSIQNDTKSLPNPGLYNVHVIPLGFQALGIGSFESGDLFVTKYEVLINQAHGAGDYGITIDFEIDYETTDWENYTIAFQTSRGGIDIFRFKGKAERKKDRASSSSRRVITAASTNHEHINITDQTTALYPITLRSGWIDSKDVLWAEEFLLIKKAWIIEGTSFVPIRINAVNLIDNDDQELKAFEIEILKESD